MDLAQQEADALMAMEKICRDNTERKFPGKGQSLSLSLASIDGREAFQMDVRRGNIELRKVTHQTRCREIVVLARLDIEGKRHFNPDGQDVGRTHLHLYREGYHAKWAFPVPPEHFCDITDMWKSFNDFLNYCKISGVPQIQWDLE
jgi:hypothetical protein